MGLNGRRLRALEECLPPSAEALGAWPLGDQLRDTFEALRVYRWAAAEKCGECTDRQLSLLLAGWALGNLRDPGWPSPGEVEFVGGVRVTWHDKHGEPAFKITGPDGGQVAADDVLAALPVSISRYVYRMAVARQPAHERFLHEIAMERIRKREEREES